jgi:hypothetical protein
MRRFVENPPVHMNELYLELACSDLKDPRFTAGQFGRQPVPHILAAVEFVRKENRRLANNLSTATAQLGEVVALFASQGKSNMTAINFLPFPQDAADNGKGGPRIGAAAAASIRRCIRDQTLPLDILVLIRSDLERANQAA